MSGNMLALRLLDLECTGLDYQLSGLLSDLTYGFLLFIELAG